MRLCLLRFCRMKDADYLIKSWHPTCNAAAFRDDIIAGFANTRVARSTIFEHTRKQKIQGMLFYRAFFRTGKTGRLSNASFYQKKTAYIDGTRPQLSKRSPPVRFTGQNLKVLRFQ